jgi:hypothetical protein
VEAGRRAASVITFSGTGIETTALSPTIARDVQFRLFFFSREEPRMHVHVGHPDDEAKFWLTPGVSLAASVGLSPHQLREA